MEKTYKEWKEKHGKESLKKFEFVKKTLNMSDKDFKDMFKDMFEMYGPVVTAQKINEAVEQKLHPNKNTR